MRNESFGSASRRRAGVDPYDEEYSRYFEEDGRRPRGCPGVEAIDLFCTGP